MINVCFCGVPRWRGIKGVGFSLPEQAPTPVPAGHPRQRGICLCKYLSFVSGFTLYLLPFTFYLPRQRVRYSTTTPRTLE